MCPRPGGDACLFGVVERAGKALTVLGFTSNLAAARKDRH